MEKLRSQLRELQKKRAGVSRGACSTRPTGGGVGWGGWAGGGSLCGPSSARVLWSAGSWCRGAWVGHGRKAGKPAVLMRSQWLFDCIGPGYAIIQGKTWANRPGTRAMLPGVKAELVGFGQVPRGRLNPRLNTYTTQPVLQQTPDALAWALGGSTSECFQNGCRARLRMAHVWVSLKCRGMGPEGESTVPQQQRSESQLSNLLCQPDFERSFHQLCGSL